MVDLHDALEKLVLGAERRILLSPAERRRTAYHEAGHAIVGMLTPGADPVRKVSIIPRGVALGVTLSAPEADRFSYDRPYLIAKIKVALGGPPRVRRHNRSRLRSIPDAVAQFAAMSSLTRMVMIEGKGVSVPRRNDRQTGRRQ
jgi:Peptidase family M41